jgi:hypothetical protein
MGSMQFHAAVDDDLRGLAASGPVPVGARGRLFAAHDALTIAGDAPGAARCGALTVAILRLEDALRRGDAARQEELRGEVAALFEQWHQARTAADPPEPRPEPESS